MQIAKKHHLKLIGLLFILSIMGFVNHKKTHDINFKHKHAHNLKFQSHLQEKAASKMFGKPRSSFWIDVGYERLKNNEYRLSAKVLPLSNFSSVSFDWELPENSEVLSGPESFFEASIEKEVELNYEIVIRNDSNESFNSFLRAKMEANGISLGGYGLVEVYPSEEAEVNAQVQKSQLLFKNSDGLKKKILQ